MLLVVYSIWTPVPDSRGALVAIRTVAALKPVAAIVLALTLGAATGQAQTAQQGMLLPAQHPVGAAVPKPPPAPLLPAKKHPRMLSPFQRVMAPRLATILNGNQEVVPGTGRSGAARPRANAAGAGEVNFPGFVSAPYLTLNDGSSSAYVVAGTVTADFNHDGKPDVAVVKEDGTISVVLSPGPGIASQTPIVTSSNGNQFGIYLAYVVAADMNGDGIPDLVGQDIANQQIVVWIGKGDGTFSAPHSYAYKLASNEVPETYQMSIVVGDFNNDGAVDVATISLDYNGFSYPYQTTIIEQTFLNNGTGALDPLPEQDTLFHDLYQQNYDNVAVTSSDGVHATGIVALLLDDNANPGNCPPPGFICGVADIVAMASNGDGTFQAPVEPPSTGIVSDGGLGAYSYGPLSATNLKAKGPGQPTTDIVFNTEDGAIWDAPFSSGNPTSAHILVGQDFWPFFLTGEPPPTSFNGDTVFTVASVGVADMNGDGLQDLVLYMNTGIAIYPNAGNGVFSAAPTQLNGGHGLMQQAQPADYDGSGYNSMVSVDDVTNQVAYLQNRGASASEQGGQFVGATVPTGTNTTNNFEFLGSNFQIYATADINGDGILDVIGQDVSDINVNVANIVVGMSNGSAPGNQSNNYTFTTVLDSTATSGPGSYGSPYFLGFIQPVTVQNAFGTSIIINSPPGSGAGYTPAYLIPVGKNGVAGAPQSLDFGALNGQTLQNCALNYGDVGDVNGDGIPDVVIACGPRPLFGQAGSGFFTFLGNADGSFQTGTFTPLGTALYQAKLINFTGTPGKLDIAAFDFDTIDNPADPALTLYVLPNKGDGSGTFDLTKLTKPLSGYLIQEIVPGDYNSDGKQDLTLLTEGQYDPLGPGGLDYSTIGVILLPGNGDYTFGTPSTVAPGVLALSASYGDFNGDGFPDLAMFVFVDNITASNNDRGPATQVLPNLGGGNFGQPIAEFSSFLQSQYKLGDSDPNMFTGAFSKSGGPDMMTAGDWGTSMFVNRGVTKLALTASSTTPGQGVPVTFTATISQVMSAGVAPTGTVSFTADGTLLGSATPDNGVATFTADSLPAGADTVTATFAGDANHNQSSASITITVAQVTPSFILSSTTPTLSVTQGSSGTVVVTVAANSTFNGIVQLTCAGAPAEVSCTPSPASVTLTPGQSAVASIFIATTPPNNTSQASNKPPLASTLVGINLAGFVFMLWMGRRRLPRYLSTLAFAALALTAFGAMSGCNGSGNKYPGTVAGNYTLTVTGVSGGITQTQTIALTVALPTK
jgi:hypothetical protein